MPNLSQSLRPALALCATAVLTLAGCGSPDAAPASATPTAPASMTQPATAPTTAPMPGPAAPAAAAAPAVPNSAGDIRPLLTGATLPALTVYDVDKKPFDLTAAAKSKPTILIFFRGGWCPYCNRHLQALQMVEPELVQLGYQIIAVTADKPELLPVDAEKDGLKYALYSDSTMAAAKALGIAFHLDDATVEKYKGYKIDLERDTGRSDAILPVPAAYVLNTEGLIAYEYINPDYRVRADTDVLIAAAKAALKPPLGRPGK